MTRGCAERPWPNHCTTFSKQSHHSKSSSSDNLQQQEMIKTIVVFCSKMHCRCNTCPTQVFGIGNGPLGYV
jgi:hypothetical protein